MIWVEAHFESVLVTLFALLAAVVILQQRRSPQSTAAWLLFIILIPVVAIPLFLGLGFRKRGRQLAQIAFHEPTSLVRTQGVATDLILQKYDIPAATNGNFIRLAKTGEDGFAEMIHLCQSAVTSLDAIFYIVANDMAGQSFMAELVAKARAGVRVRLILDRLGNLFPPRAAISALRAAGGEVLYVYPFLKRPANAHINLRNHRKMIIADNARVFAGGMNIGLDYMGPTHSAARWTDLAYLLEGPAVIALCDIFRSDWCLAGGIARPFVQDGSQISQGGATLQVVSAGPDTRDDPLHDALVQAIFCATQRVWIVTPYFIPTEFLGKALIMAARRGVDVRIIIPQKSNQATADFARGAYLREMQEAGCTVLFFQNTMLHAKAGVIDDICYVGSANFDIRSMFLNFEMVLFAYDKETVDAVASWCRGLELNCSTGLRPTGLLRRVSEGIFRLGAPVL